MNSHTPPLRDDCTRMRNSRVGSPKSLGQPISRLTGPARARCGRGNRRCPSKPRWRTGSARADFRHSPRVGPRWRCRTARCLRGRAGSRRTEGCRVRAGSSARCARRDRARRSRWLRSPRTFPFPNFFTCVSCCFAVRRVRKLPRVRTSRQAEVTVTLCGCEPGHNEM